jgi:hypothetical protein
MNKFTSILNAIEAAASLAGQIDPSISSDVQLGETLVSLIETLIPHAKASLPKAS